MEPKCCKVCTYKDRDRDGECPAYRKCARWNKWFRLEWARIRRAAANIKKHEEGDDQ